MSPEKRRELRREIVQVGYYAIAFACGSSIASERAMLVSCGVGVAAFLLAGLMSIGAKHDHL